jgi:hypothetical protein
VDVNIRNAKMLVAVYVSEDGRALRSTVSVSDIGVMERHEGDRFRGRPSSVAELVSSWLNVCKLLSESSSMGR